jgi:chemotaxis protein methyltransferase CheR
MQPVDFTLLAELLKKRSGMALTEDKIYLLESRLLPVAKQAGLSSVSDLCAHIRGNEDEQLLVEITEAMTVNESSFFRDIKPYELFRQKLLPEVMRAQEGRKSLRIWSAACSTGQEPYSLAICLKEEAAKLAGWNVQITASDLAKKVVDKAQQGIYSQFEVQRGVPIQTLLKYFTQQPDSTWQVKDAVRDAVSFCLQNLLEPYDALGQFDIIFCRNVLIYFDDATKAEITGRMYHSLQLHGILVIGATETLIDPEGYFAPIDEFRGAYRRIR